MIPHLQKVDFTNGQAEKTKDGVTKQKPNNESQQKQTR